MRRIRSKITYANVVATLALFIALGGVSYAAVKIPKNSIGEKQLKKNAVTTKKIKKNAITGDKIKPGTIKGADISLDSLGKVPRAGTADTAGSAGTAGNSNTTSHLVTFSKRLTPGGNIGDQNQARASAVAVPLITSGQVSVYAKCYLYSGTLYAETYPKTTTDGALSYGGSSSFYGGSGFLNSSTAESDSYLNYATASPNGSGQGNSYPSGSVLGPDGNALDWDIQIWAKQGNIPTYGNGAYGTGDVCIFHGHGTKHDAGS